MRKTLTRWVSKRKEKCRPLQGEAPRGRGEKVLVGRQARWPVTSPQLLRQQPALSPAVSHTTPGERTFTEKGAGSPQPQVPSGSHRSGKSDACLPPGLPGEWHVWGSDLPFTLQSALRNVLGLPPVSCTWWAGGHVAKVSRTAGRRREGMRMAKAASGSCQRRRPAKFVPAKNIVNSPISRSHHVELVLPSTCLEELVSFVSVSWHLPVKHRYPNGTPAPTSD